jgi:hypothetical protein
VEVWIWWLVVVVGSWGALSLGYWASGYLHNFLMYLFRCSVQPYVVF